MATEPNKEETNEKQKPFAGVNMSKTKKANYFKGKKKLKYVKMFEEFSLNEVQAETVAPKKINVPKQLVDDIAVMVELSKKFEKMQKSLKIVGKLLGQSETGIQATLEKLGATFLEIDTAVGKVALELKKTQTPDRIAYKDAAEAISELLPKTKDMVKKVEAIYTKATHVYPEKVGLEYKVEENVITDFLKKAGNWFKSMFDGIKKMLPGFEKSADKLTDVVKDWDDESSTRAVKHSKPNQPVKFK